MPHDLFHFVIQQASDLPKGRVAKLNSSNGWTCLDLAGTKEAVSAGMSATACAISNTFTLSNNNVTVKSQAAIFPTVNLARAAFTASSGTTGAQQLIDYFTSRC